MRLFATLALIIAMMSLTLLADASAKTVLDNSGTFSVDIPSGWSVQQTDDLINLSGPDGIPQFSVISDEADGIELDSFAEAFVKELRTSMDDFKLVSSTDTTVGGVDAKVWVYTATSDDIALKFKTYAFIRNKEIYTVIFATTVERYDEDSIGCYALVGSWTWI